MKQLGKYLTLFILVLFIFSSCLTDDEKEERTFQLELAELDDMLKRIELEGYDIDTTESGLYYVIHESGEGATPEEGDELSIEYRGYFTNGSLFDASLDHFPDGKWKYTFKDPEDPIIAGMEEGISLMNKGANYDLIVTSNLAYGATGSGLVPPFTTLIFSVIMHDITPATETE
jgi:FKBP-type peptidyl-prolyl cis-trans isomerase FkpA